MKVYKFGGASVKDAAGIRNLAKIISEEPDDLVVVVSAFGKTTNELESVLKSWFNDTENFSPLLDEIYKKHLLVTNELFGIDTQVQRRINISFSRLREHFLTTQKGSYDFEYDQIVSFGEIWSTIIVDGFLNFSGLDSAWIDIREVLITDDRFRDANILWSDSSGRARAVFDFNIRKIYVTQGFIGGTITGLTTTLGREGSDYTAAILGNILDAERVVVWKDVPGILNADPKWMPDALILDEISYTEAVEMTFSGAKVIHPKTIKPLHNKNIPMHVRSFLEPSGIGTVIKSDAILKMVIPVFR